MAHQGWYKIINTEKFVIPVDEHMKSYKDNCVQYKSSLELKMIRYLDFNKYVLNWSLEPIGIPYKKPTTGRTHRYYIDFYAEFSNGKKFLIEVKPSNETVKPVKPKTNTMKAMLRYQKAIQTWFINQAKWSAAIDYCTANNFVFKIITEKDLS
jgi:hypothetical protein